MHSQYVFIKRKSNVAAAINFVNNVINEVDMGNLANALFLGLSRAFDYFDANILLDKLFNLGFRGVGNDVIKSYITNRLQYTCIYTKMVFLTHQNDK